MYSEIERQQLWDKELELSRSEFLKIGGTVDTSVYYIVSGSLRVFIFSYSEEQTIRFGYQSEFISALDSYFSEMPSNLFIQALKATHLKVISKEKFEQLTDSTPKLRNLWKTMLQSLVLHMMERERDLLTTSPAERYERVLRRSPKLFQAIPHKYIAAYLRMTPETLSRLKKG